MLDSKDLISFQETAAFDGCLCALDRTRHYTRPITSTQQMPCYFKFRCLPVCVGLLVQHLPNPPMQLLPRRPDDRVVRLRPNELVPELEPALHLAENALLL